MRCKALIPENFLPMDSAILRMQRLSILIGCNFFLTEELIYKYIYVYRFMYYTKSTIEILVTKTTYVTFFFTFLLQADNLNWYYKNDLCMLIIVEWKLIDYIKIVVIGCNNYKHLSRIDVMKFFDIV